MAEQRNLSRRFQGLADAILVSEDAERGLWVTSLIPKLPPAPQTMSGQILG